MTVSVTIASFALGIWLYLIFAHGAFWLGRECDDEDPPALPKGHRWPSVVAVVPARNEANMLPRSLASLLAQDYPGSLSLLIVDDQSDDGTAAVAGSMASGASRELVVVQGRPLPAGWTGKVWAMQQGVAHAEMLGKRPDYLLLTDADIEYAPEALRRLVVRADAMGLVLTSLLAKLNCESLAERALIPIVQRLQHPRERLGVGQVFGPALRRDLLRPALLSRGAHRRDRGRPLSAGRCAVLRAPARPGRRSGRCPPSCRCPAAQ